MSKRRGVIFIDSFENAVLTKKQHDNGDAVLAALRRDPKVSTFEMTGTLWATLKRLAAQGRIKEVKDTPYPWHRFEVLQDEAAR